VLFAVALVTALLTAAYMGRLLFLTFFGSFRGSHEAEHHVHESPWSMLAPLVILALGSVVAGYELFPGHGGHRVRLPAVVQPVFRAPEEALHAPDWLMPAAIVSGLLGLAIAWYLYLASPPVRAKLAAPLRPLLRVFAAKYWFDDVYNAFVRHVVIGGSEGLLWKRVDAGLIDGLVNGTGAAAAGIAQRLRPFQTGFVRHYALLVLAGAVAVVSYLLWP
jgi:NADH-quinone oxidoreductase subunit L